MHATTGLLRHPRARLGAAAAQVLERLEQRRLLATIVGFEDLEIGPAGNADTGIYDDPSGFRFKLEASAGFATGDAPQIFGPPQGFASNVLHAAEWNQRFIITRVDGRPFDFLGLDHGASRFGDAGDFTLTAFLADGGQVSEVVAFGGSKSLTTLERDIESVTELRITFGGGGNEAYGALDNFVFDEVSPPVVRGSLANPDPVDGPVRLYFDERDWQQVDHLAPLPDGSFYAFGRSGEETQPLPRVPPADRIAPSNTTEWVTKHLADGSVDRSFGNNGRLPAEDLPWDGLDYRLTPVGDGNFIGLFRSPDEDHLALFDSDLQRVATFAEDGILRPGGPIRSFGVFEDGGLVVHTTDEGGVGVLRIYSPAGALVGEEELDSLVEPVFFDPDSGRTGPVRAIGNHDDGFIFVAVLHEPEPGSFDPNDPLQREYAGAVRITTDLELDTSYGVGGASRDTLIFPFETLSFENLFVGADGRSLLGVEEGDGDSLFTVFTPEGGVMGRGQYFGTADFSGNADATLVAVSFLPNDDVAIADFFSDAGDALVKDGTFVTGFSVSRFDFGVPSGGGGNVSFRDPEQPAGMSDAFVTADGGFVLGGSLEDVTLEVDEEFQQDFIIAIDHLGALWHVDFATTRIGFEDVPEGEIASGVLDRQGFRFSNVPGSGGPQSEPLRIDGPSQGYNSNVLTTLNWGRRIDVRRPDGFAFDLSSLDYAAGRWGEAGDFVLTGHFAGGTTESQAVAFNTRALTTLTLNWTNLQSFDINFAGGANDAYGALDNIMLELGEAGGPFTTGSLGNPDPVAGPVRINFSGRSWNEAYALLPLPDLPFDDRFFVIGASGIEPTDPGGVTGPVVRQPPTEVQHHVTRHLGDGSIDRTWGVAGAAPVPPELLELIGLGPFVSPRDRIQPMQDGFLMRHLGIGGLIRFDSQLERDLSFGGDGVVEAGEFVDFAVVPGGGFAVLEGDVLRVFNDDGEEIDNVNVNDQILPLLSDEGLDVRRIGDLGADAAGNIYLGVTNIAAGGPADPAQSFSGTAKFLPSLELDTDYGLQGIARKAVQSTEQETHRSLFVSSDGRTLLGINENDGARNVIFFDPSGQDGTWVRYGGDEDIWAAAFLPDNEVAIATVGFRDGFESAVIESTPPTNFPFRIVRIAGESDFETVATFDALNTPRRMRSVFTEVDNTFFIAGFQEDLELNGDFPSDIDHQAALWRVDPEG